MGKRTIKEIVEAELPDLEIVDQPLSGEKRVAGRPGPTIAELRSKYLGNDYGEELFPLSGDSADHQEEDDDVVVKKVRAKRTPADPADDLGERALIVSRSKGVLGAQG